LNTSLTICEACASHMPALALAVMKFGPRVLELGAGGYSTPLLHAISPSVVTLETDRSWVETLWPVAGNKLRLVSNMVAGAAAMVKDDWDVVFIDCYLGQDRVACAEMFLNKPCCIVAHDTERDYWQPLLKRVKHQRHFRTLLPHTSYLSNVLEVTIT